MFIFVSNYMILHHSNQTFSGGGPADPPQMCQTHFYGAKTIMSNVFWVGRKHRGGHIYEKYCPESCFNGYIRFRSY